MTSNAVHAGKVTCHNCGQAGHADNRNPLCIFFKRDRVVHADALMGDTVAHVSQTTISFVLDDVIQPQGAQKSVNWYKGHNLKIAVDGTNFTLGDSSGDGCNCLIHTLCQLMNNAHQGFRIPPGCISVVRTLLEEKHCNGPARIRPNDYLDVVEHWQDVVSFLARFNQHHKPPLDVANAFQLVCVDVVWLGHGERLPHGASPSGQSTLFVARVNQNHFVPMWKLTEVETTALFVQTQPSPTPLAEDLVTPTEIPVPAMHPETRRTIKRQRSTRTRERLEACAAFNCKHVTAGTCTTQPVGDNVTRRETEEETDESDSTSAEDDDEDELYFQVSADLSIADEEPVEQDIVRKRCAELRKCFRLRPCLPVKPSGDPLSTKDLDTGIQLPLYSCPWEGCTYSTNYRPRFLHHVAGGAADDTHYAVLQNICKDDIAWMTRLDYVYAAVALAERERWPALGLSVTRRSLNLLCKRYNDSTVKCLCCFVCGQLRTTCSSYPSVDLGNATVCETSATTEIDMYGMDWFKELEVQCPGTLLNNCSHDLWHRRYVSLDQQRNTRYPWTLSELITQPWSELQMNKERHISQYAMRLYMQNRWITLFGITEDITCPHATHHKESLDQAPYMRNLCADCSVPLCIDCRNGLWKHSSESQYTDGGTIPMSLSNDHYYGHVNRFMVEKKVTWLECAASCMVWSTMLVYYLEAPHGHLMGEVLGNPQSRTQVKGNLFSFNMPWADIEKCCHQVCLHARDPERKHLEALRQDLGVPHSEETLALLVNVHIVGGNKDLAQHLSGLTMRVRVVQQLIDILRASGYPGYESHGVNSSQNVARRLSERYVTVYGEATFTPAAVLDAVRLRQSTSLSLVQDKLATPSDAAQGVDTWQKTIRPSHIMAERSVRCQSNIQDHYASIFAGFGDVSIITGTNMTDQFVPWYLGMAFPFTLPCAVGGYDVPNHPRWRRPEDTDLPFPRTCIDVWKGPVTSTPLSATHSSVGPACKVKLFDITRGLPQRIEGQFRRHWGFVPALWNLYFRDKLNLGGSLRVQSKKTGQDPSNNLDTDAAIAAADLLKKLESGVYMDGGKRRKIAGDFSKLIFAENLSSLQRRLLADFRFRSSALPGTQEIRTQIGHLGFWASVVYGNGIFMTVSPTERHNYLAIRLSRYRVQDPLAEERHRPWIGSNQPSLEPNSSDRFDVDIPGYDLRKLWMAEDPLAAANAFFMQLRTVLATVLGLRMCPKCPYCECQDSLGSSAELPGGIAGRADAMFGAVEAQKSTGTLHYHFLFVQRLHQYATLQEIADALKAHMVNASELKHFLSNICVEKYADLEAHCANVDYLEKNFPTYSETTECAQDRSWGKIKLGRIPEFLYKDAKLLREEDLTSVPDHNEVGAAPFRTLFWESFQFFQERCQHHIHKLVNGKRLIPNACRSKTKTNECKHEAPWSNRVSPKWMTEPLLVCKGLAKRFQLKCSGARNWFGQTLTERNDEWVNGTMPGLCIALAGSNSDVKPNDRLPIMAETHEQCCKRRCLVRKHTLKRTARAAQRAQTVTNGYFGGYVGKRQFAGTLETRKCVDKMFTLRDRLRGRGGVSQARAVSGRLVTDLEMNSTFRGAVEVFNLCRNLHHHDVLMAECVRTFRNVTVDGRAWMFRLDATQSTQQFQEHTAEMYVPPTKRPHVRTSRSRPNELEIYGFRPLKSPWRLLSPYEFWRYWKAEPLLVPTHYDNLGVPSRTKWTSIGMQLCHSSDYKNGMIAAKAGRDYVAVEPPVDKYYLFPEQPTEVYAEFRHSWILVRRFRPEVVVIQGLKRPSSSRSADDNAKYCSLFFRPWTLLSGDVLVPNLALLGVVDDKLKDVYNASSSMAMKSPKLSRTGIGSAVQKSSLAQEVQWHLAWSQYVKGHIVSESAAQLIKSFLLQTMAGSGTERDAGNDSDGQESVADPEVPPFILPRDKLQQLILPALQTPEVTASGLGDQLKGVMRKRSFKLEHEKSMRLACDVWCTPSNQHETHERSCHGDQYANNYEEHLAARSQNHKDRKSKPGPFDEKRNAAATWHVEDAERHLDGVYTTIVNGEENPNSEQRAFLEHFVRRLKLEVLEMRQRTANSTDQEPLLDLIHGFPGTGKSKMIAWMRRLMSEGLKWEHGVQFVCLAFQNAMAAQINGFTLHHWSGIPCRTVDGSAGGDRHSLSIKCQALRVLIIDEISMISAELLGTLDYVVSGAVRRLGTYKSRQDGSTRPFGGVNVIMCGDFWQLHPVSGTYLCSNPLDVPPGRARNALGMFWDVGVDTIRSFWPLTEVMRCRDPWYREFLQQCRQGHLSLDMYHFFHGSPTLTAAREACTCNDDLQRDEVLGAYKESWKKAFLTDGVNMMTHIRQTECQECQIARKDRCRVLSQVEGVPPLDSISHTKSSEEKAVLSKAPALYSFNVPKYVAILLRAREFAKQHNVQLTWCYARDTPLHPGDRELKTDALNAKRIAWLQRHDQDTCNLTSLFPLAVGMPLRLTDNADRSRQLYRGRRGYLHAWTLHPQSTTVSIDNEFLVDHLPLVLYLQFPEADWKVGSLPKGVYPMTPRSRTWQVNARTGIQARRTGFAVIPDFGSTAHMIQGATLEAAFTDFLDATAKVSLSAMIAAYVCLSRVKLLRSIVVMQPFSPLLFARGPPAGPSRLMRKMSGETSAETIMSEWMQDAAEALSEKSGPTSAFEEKYRCTRCYFLGRKPYLHDRQSFGIAQQQDFLPMYLAQGCWTRCLQCQTEVGSDAVNVDAVVQARTADVAIDASMGEKVCRICAEKYPNLVCEADAHRCSACLIEYSEKMWTTATIKNHKHHPERNLVCDSCKKEGYTSHDVQAYECKDCGKKRGHTLFHSNDVWNFRRGRQQPLSCTHCKDLFKCIACKKGYEKSYWSRDALKNHRSKGINLLCKECVDAGCTLTDTALYTCTSCSIVAGRKKFDHDSMHNYRSHQRSTLLCTACVSLRNDRITHLRQQFRQSARYCKRFCLIHRARCPLTPCIYGERRWPGSDGFISESDRRFLDNLQPQPEWWKKAWGRGTAESRKRR